MPQHAFFAIQHSEYWPVLHVHVNLVIINQTAYVQDRYYKQNVQRDAKYVQIIQIAMNAPLYQIENQLK
jgi:hypothetical protein